MSEGSNVGSPGFIKVVFDYPYSLGVPSTFYPSAMKAENLFSLIKVETREGVQIYDKGKILRDNESDGKGVVVSEKKDSSRINSEIVGTALNGNPAFHHVVGRDGLSEYPWYFCEVQVLFPVNDVYSAWSNAENQEFILKTTAKLFNRFLLHYRHVSNDVHNRLLGENGDLTFYTKIYISNLSAEERGVPTLSLLSPQKIEERVFVPYPMLGDNTPQDTVPLVRAKMTSPMMNNGEKELIKPEIAALLIKGSGGVYDIKIFNEVLLSGLERFAMDDDYRVAIIEFDTAVEMAVMYYLHLLLKKEGMTQQQIEDLFDDTNEQSQDMERKRKGYLSTGSRIKRLNELNTKYLGIKNMPLESIYGSKYNEWQSDVRKKRNASVHAWERFEKEDAEKAFIAAQKFVRHIQGIGDKLI